MHGITLTKAPADWEIIQQDSGSARVALAGVFQVHQAAIDVGVAQVTPVIRVVREEDNMTIIPWTAAQRFEVREDYSGSFETILTVPAGGLYRIDTSLETKSTQPNLVWLFRGDCRLHIGVGDLFVIAGQSNSAGYSRDFCTDPPHLCVHLYRNRNCWDLASHPMNESTDAGSLPNEEMGIPGASPYLSFARNYYQITGRPVGLIQTALGGSPMKRWNPADGDLYRNMMDKINLTGGKYAGVLWYQGCSDTDPEPAAAYYENFKEFVEAVRGELGYEIPFFTMQLNRQISGINDEAWGMVREAQRRAAMEIPGVYVLSTTNLALSDGIHNNAASNVVLGERLARQCSYALFGGEEYLPPDLDSTRMISEEERKALQLAEGLWMKVSLLHVKNCLILYTSAGSESGFTVEDSRGEIKVTGVKSNRDDKNCLYLQLERPLEGETYLSFAWQADPTRLPVVDEVTYLPLLSFYRKRIG